MRHWPAALAIAALLAAPTADAAVSKPHFSRSYRGTLSGWSSATSDGQTYKSSWKLTGVVFRLYQVEAFEGGWTGLYKITAGTATWSQTETGTCSYSARDSFGIVKVMAKSTTSVPFALDRDPQGAYHILGRLDPDRMVTATETCPDPGGDGTATTTTSDRQIDIPDLFDAGEKAWKPGRRLKGTFVQKIPYDRYEKSSSTQSWSWDLKPR